METKFNPETLRNVKLFDAEKLKRHIESEDKNCVLYLDRPQLASWENPRYTFSLITPDCGLREASIGEIMECLEESDILDDSEIILSWEAHEQWYAELRDALESLPDYLYSHGVPFPYELHPNSNGVSDCYVYGDDAAVIKFIETLLVMSDVSVNTESMESQQIIMDNAVNFAVDELIPALHSENEVSSETAAALVQKVYKYTSQLFWIYSL